MDQFVYPATLTPAVQDGGFVVTFVDIPEAITQGDDVPEALHQAADCLEEAMRDASDVVTTCPSPRLSRLGNMRWPCRPRRQPKRPCMWPCVRGSSPRWNSPHGCSATKKRSSLARPPSRLEAVASGSGARPLRAANSHRRVPVQSGGSPGQPRHRRRPCESVSQRQSHPTAVTGSASLTRMWPPGVKRQLL